MVKFVHSLMPRIVAWVCDLGQLLTSGEYSFTINEMDSILQGCSGGSWVIYVRGSLSCVRCFCCQLLLALK